MGVDVINDQSDHVVLPEEEDDSTVVELEAVELMRPLVVATDEVLDPVVEPVSDAEELILEVGTVVTGVVEVVEPRSGVVVESVVRTDVAGVVVKPVVTTDVSGVVVELEVTVEVKGAVEASGVVEEPNSVVL